MRNLLKRVFSRPAGKQLDNPIAPSDLCIPIYLNQQVVFDLLAVFDDGFSRLSTIKTSTGETETNKYGMGGSIGVSNAFALLGVSFSGERDKEKGLQRQTEISQEKVHTPTSLFVKLKLKLQDRRLVRKIDSSEALVKLSSGDFVEYKAILRQNPLIDTLENVKKLMEMATLFASESARANAPKQKATRSQNQTALITRQLDGMLSALTQSNSIELVGELVDAPGAKSVLTSKLEFFSAGTASEIIDGEFHVLGKVTRVIQRDAPESINLLRKTAFGRLDQKLFEGFAEAIAGAEEAGLHSPEFVTEIKGPALLVVPIAIYL